MSAVHSGSVVRGHMRARREGLTRENVNNVTRLCKRKMSPPSALVRALVFYRGAVARGPSLGAR